MDNSATGAPVALVTGGAKRLGMAIALRLHEDGYRICVHYYHSSEEANEAVAKMNDMRSQSAVTYKESLSADTSTGSDGSPGRGLSVRCSDMVRFCYTTFGRCDVLVNNASAYYPTPLLGPEDPAGVFVEEEAADLFGSNAIAPYYLIRAFARQARGAGVLSASGGNLSVVNMVDSMAGQPLLNFSMYTMAKHALDGLTKAAAAELAAVGIRVNGVGPGLSVLQPSMPQEEKDGYRSKVPLGQRESTGEEVAEVVSFLVSEKARYMTGALVNVDGGWSLTRA